MDASRALDLLNRGVFVGRDAEHQRLAACLDDARAGRPKLIVIGGEPGVGKTALLRELLASAAPWWACEVQCAEPSLEPYGPLPEIVRRVSEGMSGDELRRLLGARRDAIARFAFGESDDDASHLVDTDDHLVLRDGIVALLRGVARRAPLLICIEHLHAAQDPALRLLGDVVAALAAAPVVIVATLRPEEPGAIRPVLALGRRIPTDAFVQIDLAGLRIEEVRGVLEAIAGHPVPEIFVARLHTASGGNPLLLIEMIRELLRQGVLVHDGSRWVCRTAPAEITLPRSVRAILEQRLAGLGPDMRRVLEAAALFPSHFDLARLATLTETDDDAASAALDVAMRSALVATVWGPPGRYRFRHGIFRRVLHDGIDIGRRGELHRAIARGMEDATEGATRASELDILEIAYHYREAAVVGGVDAAVRWSLRAAALEERRHNFDAAATHYADALHLAHREGCLGEEESFDAAVRMLEALGKTGRIDDLRASTRIVAPTARRLGGSAFARVALAGGSYMRGFGRFRLDGELVALLEEAIVAFRTAPFEPGMLVRLQARLAGELMMGSGEDHERGRRAMAEALDGLRECPDARLVARVLRDLRFAPRPDGDLGERLARVREEVVETAGIEDDDDLRLEVETERAIAHLEQGDGLGATRVVEGIRHAAEARPYQRWVLACLDGCIAGLDGRLDDVERLAIDAHRLGIDAQVETAGVLLVGTLGPVQWLRGRLDEVEAALHDLPSAHPHAFPALHPIQRAALAVTLAEAGRHGEARIYLDQLSVDDPRGIPANALWLPTAVFLSLAYHAVGETRYADMLYRRMLPFAGRIALLPPVAMFGAADFALGLLADLAGRPRDARRHLEDAVVLNRRTGCRPWLARALVELAVHLQRAGDERDGRVHELLRDALELATRLDQTRTAERIQSLLALEEPGPYFVLKELGEVWMIGDETGQHPFNDRKGYPLLRHLLERPGLPVDTAELCTLLDGVTGDAEKLVASRQHSGPSYDAKTIEFFASYLRELKDLAASEEDEERRRRIDDEIDEIERAIAKYRRANENNRGEPRPHEHSESEKKRQRVKKLIVKALECIEPFYPRLVAHLGRALHTGGTCVYAPPPDDRPRWILR